MMYFQVALGGELGGMPFDILTGLRYEKTDTESSSLVSRVYFQWEDNNDIFSYVDSTVPPEPAFAENDYDYLLPSLDVTLNLTDDLVSRFSYSKTIARAGLGNLGVSASNFGGGGGSTLLGAQPTANGANPALLPLESSNFDLSLEWYYNPFSYMSAGIFQKNVINFIGSRQIDQPLEGIRDVTGGPRALAAAQAVRDAGFPLDDTYLFAMMAFTEFRNHPDMIARYGANPQFTGAQPHIGFTYWRNPPANLMPVVAVAEPMTVADMGVAAEGSPLSWPISEYQGQQLVLDSFYPHGQQQRTIEVFNKGTVPFEFNAKASADWVKLSHSSGKINVEQHINVSIDWSKTETGLNNAEVHIQGTGWGGAKIQLAAVKPATTPTQGFVEADGYIAIEAASGKTVANNKQAWWQEIPGHGRTYSSMSAMTVPDYQTGAVTQAPYLEYPLFFHSTGSFTLHSIVAPTLDLVPGRGLRFAVALNNNPPQPVDTLADKSQQVWEQSVLDGVRIIKSPLQVTQPGAHTLRIYLVDPALVLQKLLIDTGGLKPSYLGPQQSKRLR